MILNSKNKKIKKVAGYFYLLIIISFLLSFVIYIAPVIDEISLVEPLVGFIDERGIDAGALYYTDIPEFSTAEINLQNTMDFLPAGRMAGAAKVFESLKY